MQILLLLSLAGCDDTLFGLSSDDEVGETNADTSSADTSGNDIPEGDEVFCDVLNIFVGSCLICHSAAVASGDLDLETDPHGELVDQPSGLYAGETLVAPNDPDGSLLYAKVSDTQSADQGSVMPTTGHLDGDAIEVIQLWIAEGAGSVCGGGVDTAVGEGYHPEGWEEPLEHGMAAKFQEDDCLECHGDDLNGGSVGISCDDCHEAGWRTHCTFCHGGTETGGGAPPRDIDGATSESTYPPHTAHVTTNIHGAYDCVQCHTKPSDVLSVGHFLVDDATPGVSEVIFSGGLSDAASYASGSCSNLYCHGNGQGDNGSSSVGQSFESCSSCHSDSSSGEDGWDRMSGEHADHIDEGMVCSDCHGLTVSGGQTMIGPEHHVDGDVDLLFEGSITMSGQTCNGICHDEDHEDKDWD